MISNYTLIAVMYKLQSAFYPLTRDEFGMVYMRSIHSIGIDTLTLVTHHKKDQKPICAQV